MDSEGSPTHRGSARGPTVTKATHRPPARAATSSASQILLYFFIAEGKYTLIVQALQD